MSSPRFRRKYYSHEERLAGRAAKNREYYHRQHSRHNHRQPWTSEHDAIVLAPGTLADAEVAQLLGRSVHSVDNRRYTLKRAT